MTLTTEQVLTLIAGFRGSSLTHTLASIEQRVQGMTRERSPSILSSVGVSSPVLRAAGEMKRLSSQIDVVIHALGILLCLPKLLEADEKVERVSLGAGNSGRAFDLETNRRVAEFKFIRWQGGAESIRQNGIFKDFFLLQAANTDKQKYLYLLDTYHPLKFFNGGRALTSVLKDQSLSATFKERHGDRFKRVSEYYAAHIDAVHIVDVAPLLPELAVLLPNDC